MTTTIEDDGLPPILIYTVEDENYVVLKIDGVLVAQRLASTPAGSAILKLDAAIRSSPAGMPSSEWMREKIAADPDMETEVRSSTAVDGVGEPWAGADDNALAQMCEDFHPSSVAFANDPDEFHHLIEFTPEQLRGFIAAKPPFSAIRSAISPTSDSASVVEAGELANEIWESLFGITKDAVPESLTDDVLKALAEHLLAGHDIRPKPAGRLALSKEGEAS